MQKMQEFLVGTPYQTIENVSEDLLFMKQFMPQMIQIAPFLAAKHTPFERERGGNADMVLYLMAIARLMFRGSILIADVHVGSKWHYDWIYLFSCDRFCSHFCRRFQHCKSS